MLKKELIHAQTLMDQLSQEREKEKEMLQKEHDSLQAKHQRCVNGKPLFDVKNFLKTG